MNMMWGTAKEARKTPKQCSPIDMIVLADQQKFKYISYDLLGMMDIN